MDEEKLTLEEIKDKYEVKEVLSRECYVFKDGHPRISDFDEGGPEYFFEAGQDEIVLITTIGPSSRIYYKTTFYKEGG